MLGVCDAGVAGSSKGLDYRIQPMTVKRGHVFQYPSISRVKRKCFLKMLLGALPVRRVLFCKQTSRFVLPGQTFRAGQPKGSYEVLDCLRRLVCVQKDASYAKDKMRINGLRIDSYGLLEILCSFLESKCAACFSTLIDP
jgi:hypothetical protein